ncbi:hypothetical protein FBU30_000453 [Linnemannia zychae]|nr:hypothetical protein FBU30_000453 [Linnemannia zychae]
MMASRPCGNCKKTVYVNDEKLDVEGRWYHRACFKCLAPNCGTSLTLRTFQMAALDDSVIDDKTNRPLKVPVCRDHVPKPKATSLGADSLSLKHSTSTPKPSMASIYRSFMPGDQSRGTQNEEDEQTSDKAKSHKEGLHTEFKRESRNAPLSVSTAASSLASSKSPSDALHSGSSSVNAHTPKSTESEVRSMPTTTLPRFHKGRFTAATSGTPTSSDTAGALHATAGDAQDPTTDDDSYRTIPIHHHDYEHSSPTATSGEEEDNKQRRIFTMKATAGNNKIKNHLDSDVIEASLETKEDVIERVEREHLNVNLRDEMALEEAEIKAPPGEKEEHKLVDMAFSSKVMEKRVTGAKKDPEVEDDEWDVPVDDYHRRETAAGI